VRIGVAIPVPPPFAAELRESRRRFGDPLADAIPPHITLLGPTVVEPDEMAGVREHLTEVAAHVGSFLVHLRSSGTFRPVSEVVFVQVAQGIAECETLERKVRSGPLAQELRFHYHPHVTVAHDVSDAGLNVAFEEMSDYEASFAVNAIALYECGDDQVWRPVEEYRLGSPLDDDFVTEIVHH
jgi:2'-5' RNA ligase